MGWRQQSERGWDGIEAEHVIMVPKTHRLTVDNQVMLHPLGLSTQLVILRDAGIERLAGVGVAHPGLLPLGDGRLDGLTQRRHVTQQHIQTVAVTPRLGSDLFQNLPFDRRQRVSGL